MNNRKKVLAPFLKKQDYMETRIRQGIEANRKAWCRIRIEDEEHRPLPGVKFRAVQARSDFKCGANLFMLGEFKEPERNAEYESRFAKLFNFATLPFYWRDVEPEQGKTRYEKSSPPVYRRPPIELCLEFCESHGIEPKAHCLNYAGFSPEWLPRETEAAKRFLYNRFRELAERYSGRIPEWEVTNETLGGWNCFYERFPFYREPDYVEWSFRAAERFFPVNRLFINEMQERIWDALSFYGDRSAYFMQIERALRAGVRIDGIGMQFHMFHRREQEVEKTIDYYDPERIYDVLDCYAAFGKPIQITESTIPAYSYDAADEDVQAEIIRNLYRIWFSHPAVEGAVYWNLVDGYAAWTVPGDMAHGENYYHGGLIRYDFTPKPAWHILHDLFRKEWRTSAELETDENGEASLYGFTGEYELSGNGFQSHFRMIPRRNNTVTMTVGKN